MVLKRPIRGLSAHNAVDQLAVQLRHFLGYFLFLTPTLPYHHSPKSLLDKTLFRMILLKMIFSEEVTKEVCTIEYISEKINAEATLVEVTNMNVE